MTETRHPVLDYPPVRPPGFRPVPVCRSLLPVGARTLLIDAAATEPHIPPGESTARTLALERATFYVRAKNPTKFIDFNRERN